MFWSQNARIQWLQEGDQKTSFFHASVIQRRKCNKIATLEKERGGIYSTKEDMIDEISGFYEDLFTSADSGGWEHKLDGISSSITGHMNSRLIRPVTDSEVKTAVFAMNPNKAPGMDGMTSLFFFKIFGLLYKMMCVMLSEVFFSLVLC